ncbi:MAG: drug/metabolite transporter (DMT)-like permease [Candidatus Azotimanducaceae bacterium]|jgi:drug/metabolite transporter (DMT)-like permease
MSPKLLENRKDRMDLLAISFLIGFNIILGLNQALVKLVNAGFSPLFQGGLRSLCALLPVLIFAMIMRRRLSVNDGSLSWGMLNGFFFSIEFGLLFIALDYTTVARVSLFFYMMPVWVTIAAHFLIPEEPLNRNKLMGLVLAVLGVTVGFSGNLGEAGKDAWLGDMLALFGGMFWAAIAMITRLKLNRVSSEMNLLYQLFVSGILLTLLALFLGEPVREPTAMIYGILAFQVIVIVSIGFLVWFWVLLTYPVSNMASFSLLTPIFGVFFGWLIFDDVITPVLGIALLLVGAGIILINRRM